MEKILDIIGKVFHIVSKYLLTFEFIMAKTHEERQKEIIDVTLELAAEKGVKQLTTQAIADRIGIAQSTIFKHFKTRDAIFGAAIGWISTQLFRILEATAANGDMPEERLRTLIKKQLALMSSHKGLPRLLFSDRLHLESPALKKTVRQVMERYTERIAELLKTGMESGSFRKDLDPEGAARYIVASIQGLVVRWSIFDFSFAIDEEGEKLWNFLQGALKR